MITNNFKKILMLMFSSVMSSTSNPAWPYTGTLPTLVSTSGKQKQIYLSNSESYGKAAMAACINAMNHASTMGSDSTLYLKAGTGTITPTENDYELESINSNISCDSVVVGNSANYTKTYTAIFSNPTDTDIVISEMGLYGKIMYYNGGSVGTIYYEDFLFDRTVLSAPITIPAGESKAITYELGF